MKNSNSTAMLVLFVVACIAISGLGALFTAGSVQQWYPALQKPVWTPPSWLFGPVWTILYLMMAVAAWLVWRRRKSVHVKGALGLFFIQLAINAAWSPLFFGLQNPLAGLLNIALLWAAILATLIAFRRISSTAAALLVPYWLWVSYASALNFAIWNLNR